MGSLDSLTGRYRQRLRLSQKGLFPDWCSRAPFHPRAWCSYPPSQSVCLTVEADLTILAGEAQDKIKAFDGFAVALPGGKEPSGGEQLAQRPLQHPV